MTVSRVEADDPRSSGMVARQSVKETHTRDHAIDNDAMTDVTTGQILTVE